MIWLRRLAWLVGAVLLLLMVTWLAVPALIKWQLPLRASEALGRQVTLRDAAFHPWNLDLTLNDLAVAGLAGTAEPLLQVGTLHTNFSVSSLFRLAPVIEALEIDALRLRVARTSEGHYDIDDLITRFTPKAEDKPSDGSAHFALYNVQVRDAQLRFDDRPVKRVQQVDALHLSLPFISNLPAQVEIKVEPRLAFKLNGADFDTGAQATPFAQTRSGDMKLQVKDLDLAPYLGYLPATLPVRVTQGSVSADIGLNFALPPNGKPNLVLKGTAEADRLALTDTAGAPLLAWDRLQLGLRDVQPLARSLAFDSLQVEGLQLHAARDAQGQVNLLALSPARPAAPVEVAPAPAASAPAAAALPPWKFSLGSLTLVNARVLWNDAVVHPAAALQLDQLAFEAKDVQWPLAQPIQVSLKGALHNQTAGGPALAEFSARGPVTDHDAKLAVTLGSVSLGGFAPYLAQALVPSVEGQLGAQADIDWSGASDAPRLRLHLATLALDNLKVREAAGKPGQDAVAFKQLALADVDVDLLARSVALGSVKLLQPAILLARDKDGRLNVQGWAAGAGAAPSASPEASAPAGAQAAWRLQLKDLLIDDGQLRLSDAAAHGAGSAPVRLELAKLHVGLQGLSWQGDRSTAPANLQVSARVGGITPDRQRPSGAIDYRGRVGMQPLLAEGDLKVERFPVQLLAPYFADQVQLTLLRAEAGYSGSVKLHQSPAGMEVNAAGDVLLGDVHIATLPARGSTPSAGNTDELLSWQAFSLKGVKVAIKPKARPRIDIAEAALTDFYSRLVITEQGRFNLRDVGAKPGDDAPLAGQAASAPTPAPAAASGVPADDAPLPVDVRVGATLLTNGRVDFTDHFVRPNYSAALTELNGQLGAFGTESREMATLSLRGHAEGTALLEINGQVNPLAKPLALDIHAKATDLELAPLSPYAGKYVGYAIERGKLTMDVSYKIDPDGKLAATNQVVLNQLTFGDKIESKDAIKLPVLLAVALLKDRNGVIDINLPISGSINDPKFSVGGLIFKVIVNLLTKALTSPFSLLAGGGGGGGGDDLSQVAFMPGTAQIEPSGMVAIDKVAKALTDRPALKMTVTGAADTAAERDAFQAAAVEQRLVDEKRREGLRAGAPATPASAPVTLAADDRTRLLKAVYKDTDIPTKPRNAIGFAKDIPGPEMEALLKSRVPVNDDVMRDLALKRGIAVRDALLAKGLPSDRLFLAAPKLEAAGTQGTGWTPKVQLSLAAN